MPWWCGSYGAFLFLLGGLFLIIAAAGLLAETWATIRERLAARRTAAAPPTESVLPIDPEAVNRLLETLKGLPPWIAAFLAGLALVWIAGQRPEACTAEAAAGDNAAGTEAAANHSGDEAPAGARR